MSATTVLAYGTPASNPFSNGDLVGFGGNSVTMPGLTGGGSLVLAQDYYVVQAATTTFKVANSAGGSALTFTSGGTASNYGFGVAPALSYFMMDKVLNSGCNPCWGGYVFGYMPKNMLQDDGGYQVGYELEYALISSRGTTLTPAVMSALNTNQCQAYGGLC